MGIKVWLTGIVLALLGVAAMPPAHAQSVTPTVSVIELPRNRGGVTLGVFNPRDENLPVVFEIVERAVMEDGSEQRTPADNSFLIFPPQAIIPPNGRQSVRVQWLEQPPSPSRSFTFYAAEQPVALDADQSGVTTLFKIGASVHVVQQNADPKPVLRSAQPVAGGYEVTLGNDGDRFYYVNDVGLRFGRKTYAGVELADIAGRTLVPPGRVRTFVVPEETASPRLVLR